jgi:hypothetical protein
VFDSRWNHWVFQLTYSFQQHYGPGVYSPSNKNYYKKPSCRWRAAGALCWQPHRHLWADCLENVRASTSDKPTVLHGLLHEQPYDQVHNVFRMPPSGICSHLDQYKFTNDSKVRTVSIIRDMRYVLNGACFFPVLFLDYTSILNMKTAEVPPRSLWIYTGHHGVTSQIIVAFIALFRFLLKSS